MTVRCAIFGHEAIDPRLAWHDGVSFRANCPRCDVPMIQDALTGTWSLFSPTDYDARRAGRPNQPRHDDVWRH